MSLPPTSCPGPTTLSAPSFRESMLLLCRERLLINSSLCSADDVWYRARIRRANPARKEAEVIYVDCAYHSPLLLVQYLHPTSASSSASRLFFSPRADLSFASQTETRRSSLTRVFAHSHSSSKLLSLRPRRRYSASSTCSATRRSTASTPSIASASSAR